MSKQVKQNGLIDHLLFTGLNSSNLKDMEWNVFKEDNFSAAKDFSLLKLNVSIQYITYSKFNKWHNNTCTAGIGQALKVMLLFCYFCLVCVQLSAEGWGWNTKSWQVQHVPCSKICDHTHYPVFFWLHPQDKRRIQEDIAKKRRQIEEEKLKLQYIKVLQKTPDRTTLLPSLNDTNIIEGECYRDNKDEICFSFLKPFNSLSPN